MLSSGTHSTNFFTRMWFDINTHGTYQGEIYNKHKNGEIYIESITISAVKDSDGNITNYVSNFHDITKQKNEIAELVHGYETELASAKRLSHYDPLTGLGTRRLLGERLALTNRFESPCSLLMLDLDKFKAVNDTYGHECGDILLRQVSNRLSRCIRSSTDLVARLGGDEFVILLEGVLTITELRAVASGIIDSLSVPFCLSNNIQVHIGTSIGISKSNFITKNPTDLLAQADTAMYESKSLGGNHYTIAPAVTD